MQAIGKRTFTDTYGKVSEPSHIQQYLDENFSPEKLRTGLTDPHSEFYFAKVDNKPVGYLKVNFAQAQTMEMKGKGMEIERIYALKEWHGKGVGPALFNKALEIATQKKSEFIWLGVMEGNNRAIRFYEKSGFKITGIHPFLFGGVMENDIMMRLEL